MTKAPMHLRRLLSSTAKAGYQYLRFRSGSSKIVGLIMGMQRSGTGMLNQAFGNDWSCQVFGEDGGLALGISAGPRMRWRWRPYSEVAAILERQRAPLLIAKPLVESQCADRILEALPGARIIWAYRHYQDVAVSAQRQFGAEPINIGLKAILEGRPDWYSENLADETRSVVQKYYYASRDGHDLWALGWYVRNALVLRYGHLPLTLVDYDNLVQYPVREMRSLYAFLDYPYPGDQIVKHIHARSIERGRSVEISADVRALCDTMLANLESMRWDASGARRLRCDVARSHR